MSINAVKGFEYGSGFSCSNYLGSNHNDNFIFKNNEIKTEKNFSGGIQGGISNGEDIYFRTALKPVPTLMKEQILINNKGEKVKIPAKGRHDVCVLSRAVPVVEAMTAIVLVDFYLRQKTDIF